MGAVVALRTLYVALGCVGWTLVSQANAKGAIVVAFGELLSWLDSSNGYPSTEAIMQRFGWTYDQLEQEMADLVKNNWVERVSVLGPQDLFHITKKGRQVVKRLDS